MMAWLDRLNLQPQERRAVLAGLLLVALVLNYWLIWPYFKEWRPVNDEIEKTRTQNTKYLAEIGKKATYETKLRDLQKSGGEVLQEEQGNRVQSTIWAQSQAHGVTILSLTPANSRRAQTNQFFDEQVMTAEVNANEEQLVNFLHALGSDDSMIRVRDMSRLRLDPSQTRLQTRLSLVASFQKKPKATPPPAAKPSGAAAVQPKGPSASSTNRPSAKK
jgi:hypothetical protein